MNDDTRLRDVQPNKLAALNVLIATLDDDKDEVERIVLDAGLVPVALGLVAVATGLGEHIKRSPAATRQMFLEAAQAVEINAICPSGDQAP